MNYEKLNKKENNKNNINKKFILFLNAAGIITLSLLLFILITLLFKSFTFFKTLNLSSIFSIHWDPVNSKYGILPFLTGTLITSVLALIVSIPFSLSISIYSVFYTKSKFVKDIFINLINLLAGIPSVIYGFWGLFFLVPIIRIIEIKLNVSPYGVGMLTASIILSIMIIPYSASIIREVFLLIPEDLIAAGYSLGSTKYEILKKIIIPYSKSGIMAGILLAFGRAFGETMAVTMVIGNSNKFTLSIFSPANTMASVIANEFAEATNQIHQSALIYIGLWLFLITLIVNYISNLIISKFEKNNTLFKQNN